MQRGGAASTVVLALSCALVMVSCASHDTVLGRADYERGVLEAGALEAGGGGRPATSLACDPRELSSGVVTTATLPDASSGSCEALSCPGDGGCATFEWPVVQACNTVASLDILSSVVVGCGFIVVEARAGGNVVFEQSIYDQRTGALVGTRSSLLSGQPFAHGSVVTCADARPGERLRTKALSPWKDDCPSAIVCDTCWPRGASPRTGYACTCAAGTNEDWRPDGGT